MLQIKKKGQDIKVSLKSEDIFIMFIWPKSFPQLPVYNYINIVCCNTRSFTRKKADDKTSRSSDLPRPSSKADLDSLLYLLNFDTSN